MVITGPSHLTWVHSQPTQNGRREKIKYCKEKDIESEEEVVRFANVSYESLHLLKKVLWKLLSRSNMPDGC